MIRRPSLSRALVRWSDFSRDPLWAFRARDIPRCLWFALWGV